MNNIPNFPFDLMTMGYSFPWNIQYEPVQNNFENFNAKKDEKNEPKIKIEYENAEV
jgi:hypothetical protein